VSWCTWDASILAAPHEWGGVLLWGAWPPCKCACEILVEMLLRGMSRESCNAYWQPYCAGPQVLVGRNKGGQALGVLSVAAKVA
jgi:hypothetical protein